MFPELADTGITEQDFHSAIRQTDEHKKYSLSVKKGHVKTFSEMLIFPFKFKYQLTFADIASHLKEDKINR